MTWLEKLNHLIEVSADKDIVKASFEEPEFKGPIFIPNRLLGSDYHHFVKLVNGGYIYPASFGGDDNSLVKISKLIFDWSDELPDHLFPIAKDYVYGVYCISLSDLSVWKFTAENAQNEELGLRLANSFPDFISSVLLGSELMKVCTGIESVEGEWFDFLIAQGWVDSQDISYIDRR